MLLKISLFHFLCLSSILFYIYHVYFIHSSVDGHLGCFHVLAIVNILLWTLRWIYLFELQFCLDVCPGVGLQDHTTMLFLVFWGTSILFFIVASPVYIPIYSIGGLKGGRDLWSKCWGTESSRNWMDCAHGCQRYFNRKEVLRSSHRGAVVNESN